MTLIEQAHEMGKQAFLNGKKCIPCQDKNVMTLIGTMGGDDFRATSTVLSAWHEGWHQANLAAPVTQC